MAKQGELAQGDTVKISGTKSAVNGRLNAHGVIESMYVDKYGAENFNVRADAVKDFGVVFMTVYANTLTLVKKA